MEASLGVVLAVVALALLDDAQLQDLLSGQQVDLPRVLGHSAGAVVLARLEEEMQPLSQSVCSWDELQLTVN